VKISMSMLPRQMSMYIRENSRGDVRIRELAKRIK
jgi:hypothetical protein